MNVNKVAANITQNLTEILGIAIDGVPITSAK